MDEERGRLFLRVTRADGSALELKSTCDPDGADRLILGILQRHAEGKSIHVDLTWPPSSAIEEPARA